jgi:hypothetical protein
MLDTYHDEESMTYAVLRSAKNEFVVESDLEPLVREIVATHPGLEFLGNMELFQDRYGELLQRMASVFAHGIH